VQPAFSAGYAGKSDVRAVSKMIGEFLKPCGRQVQVNCCCPPDWGPLIGKQRWVGSQVSTGCKKKKNASFESKHEKHIVFAGIRAIKVYVLGTTGCRATAT
jgi:hypothetical protein